MNRISPRVKKALKRAAIFVIAIVALHSVVTFALFGIARYKFAMLRKNGGVTCFDKIAVPSIPDSKNGAVEYNKAFKLLPQSDSPIYSLRDRNECAKDPQLWSKAHRQLQELKEILTLVKKAQAKPFCRFKVNWKDGVHALFPHASHMHDLSEFIIGRALVEAHKGNMKNAADTLESAVKLTKPLENDPVFICYAYRCMAINLATWAIPEIAGYGQIDATDARRLSDILSGIDLVPSYVNTLKTERTVVPMAIEDNPHLDDVGFTWVHFDEHFWAKIRYSYLGRPLLYLDEIIVLNSLGEQIRLADRPFSEFPRNKIELMQNNVGIPGQMLCPGYINMRLTLDYCRTNINCTRIFLALQTYKKQFDSYPARLSILEKALDWHLDLNDPYSDHQLVYKKRGNGFLLYSIGPDQKDNGGRKLARNEDYLHPLGDIVWKMDR